MTDLAAVRRHIDQRADALVDDIRALVEIESPTGDVAQLDAAGRLLAGWWSALGADLRRHERPGVGTHLEFRWSGEAPVEIRERRPALLVGHVDTVHDVGTLARNPLRVEDGRLYGPGTQDMKAGLAMTVHAVRALTELGIPPARPLTVLITVDEEMGSLSSADLVRELARESAHALVLEASGPDGELKTARKGVGLYDLVVTGRAAHAGVDFEAGRNANIALARLLPAVAALTDLDAGTTVNVGLVRGGTRANVVPETARAQVDLRFFEPSEAERVDAALHALVAGDSTRIEVTGGVNRPAMLRTEASAALIQKAQAVAEQVGLDLGEIAVGGASDGNFTAAGGCPTLDGLGAVGAGLHTIDEWVDVAALPARTALLAGLLATL